MEEKEKSWCYSAGIATCIALEAVRVAVEMLDLGTWISDFSITCRYIGPAAFRKYEIKGRTNVGFILDVEISTADGDCGEIFLRSLLHPVKGTFAWTNDGNKVIVHLPERKRA